MNKSRNFYNGGHYLWWHEVCVMGITSLHLCSVLGRDNNKELSSIQAKSTSKGYG